jgi:DNA end-binding protein Ku
MRAIWSGYLGFGAISVPIKLYSAVEKDEVKLHRLCRKCGSEIGYVNRCKSCGQEVPFGEWDMGYEVSDKEFMKIPKEVLDSKKPETNENITLFAFIQRDDISPLSITGDHYFIGTNEKKRKNENARIAYQLLNEILKVKKKVGIGKFCARGKENLVMIEPFNGGLLLTKLYYATQIRACNDVFFDENYRIDSDTLKLAESLIDKYSKFNYEEQKNEYIDMLKRVISGQVPTEIPSTTPKVEESSDIRALLKMSV